MLERVIGCLENGGRRLVHKRTSSIRSRRLLHSTFWNHGAGNIELPSWWISLLQVPTSGDSSLHTESGNNSRGYHALGFLASGFLDFLYPAQTLALIRRFAGVNRKVSNSHPCEHGRVPRSRAYTSVASVASENSGGNYESLLLYLEAQSGIVQENLGTHSKVISEVKEEALRRFSEFLRSGRERNYEEAWTQYRALQESNTLLEPSVISAFMNYLTSSTRPTDAQRVSVLMDDLPVGNRQAINYRVAINASLQSHNLQQAITLHREASSRVRGSFGTSILLTHLVDVEDWCVAAETWDDYWQHNRLSPADIWGGIDAFPLRALMDKARAAADFALRAKEKSRTFATDYRGAEDFASSLIRRALGIRHVTFEIEKQAELFGKLGTITKLTSNDCRMIILQLLSVAEREYESKALKLYRKFRMLDDFAPDLFTLQKVLELFCRIHSATGVPMMLDDYRKYHQGPTAVAYRNILHELAYQGDADAVHSLFEERCSRIGKSLDMRDLSPLLIVHIRRGEPQLALDQFQRLRQDFGLESSTRPWNMVLAAFARVGDAEGSTDWFYKMLESKVKPDDYTFGTMMTMYANRGDTEAAEGLLQKCASFNVKPTTAMIDSLVTAHINNDEVEEAEDLVESAIDMNLDGSRTHMWNSLLNAYALRSDIGSVSRLYERMQEKQIPIDGVTFAALMQSLAIKRQPHAAEQILELVMPRKRIQVNAMHYAVVMGGWLRARCYGDVFRLYNRMLKKNVKPTLSTQTLLLKAAVNSEMRQHENEGGSQDTADFSQAEAMLDQIMSTVDGTEIAPKLPLKGIGPQRLDEASISNYFDYFIFIYGHRKAFDKVSKLYDSYKGTIKSLGRDENSIPPIKMLSALMVAHNAHEEYSDVERCWELAKAKATELTLPAKFSDTFRQLQSPQLSNETSLEDPTAARRSLATTTTADPSSPVKSNSVLPSRRHFLATPFMQYMKSLVAQGQLLKTSTIIEELQTAGYTLDHKAWNFWVQTLATNGQVRKAFAVCEIELMPHWNGWWFLRKGTIRLKQTILRLNKRMPTYKTMVLLASAYGDVLARNGYDLNAVEVAEMKQTAPMLLEALASMKRTNDSLQVEYLRR